MDNPPTGKWLAALAGMLAIAWCGEPAIAQDPGYDAHKTEKLGSMQGEYLRITRLYSNDPALEGYRLRLALIDELGGALAGRVKSISGRALDELLTDVMKPSGKQDTQGRDDAFPPLSARTVYTEYQKRLSAPLPMPAASAADAAFLKDYYQATVKAAESYVIARCDLLPGLGRDDQDEALGLCLVIPLLCVPDEEWSTEDIDALPDKLKKAAALKTLEYFTLTLRRPLSAIAFASYALKETWAPGRDCEYLMQSAARLRRDSEFHASLHCLKVAGRIAAQADADTGMRVYCDLAELYEWLGHPEAAAATAADALGAFPQSRDRGKAATIRLKCLYRADQHAKILQEAPQYQEDERCKPYSEQIIYISWLTHRREGKTDLAKALQAEFMERYPTNPLCADMCFASALTALASGEYSEASGLLDLIENQYPNSRAVNRARKVKEEMEKDWTQPSD